MEMEVASGKLSFMRRACLDECGGQPLQTPWDILGPKNKLVFLWDGRDVTMPAECFMSLGGGFKGQSARFSE